MGKVAVVECEEYEPPLVQKAVNNSIDLCDGTSSWEEDSNVLIKPNLIGPYTPNQAVTTHPTVVEALILNLKSKGMNVFLGESSGGTAKNGTAHSFRKSGLEDIAKKHNIEIINFDKDERVRFNASEALEWKNISISKRLSEMDYIVNAPKLKTHTLTRYTGAIKNMFGVIPGRTKVSAHTKGKDISAFSNILLDIYDAVTPDLTVMDGIVGMEGKGPTHGTPKQTGIILAGKSGIDLDYIATGIIGFKPFEIEMLRLAKKRKMFNEYDTSILGEKNISMDYKRPSKSGGKAFSFFSGLLKPYFVADQDRCVKCGECADACPEDAITITKGNYPVWDRDNCATCYCCDELCRQDAVVKKDSFVAKVVNKITRRYND